MMFQKKYFFLTLLLFLIEVLIAICIHDKFIRPYIGDVLVVMLIYCFLRIFVKGKTIVIAFSVFLFACIVELLQYFRFIEILGWEDSKLAKTIIGHSASYIDLLAYFAGFLLILLFEKKGFPFLNTKRAANN